MPMSMVTLGPVTFLLGSNAAPTAKPDMSHMDKTLLMMEAKSPVCVCHSCTSLGAAKRVDSMMEIMVWKTPSKWTPTRVR